MSVSHIKIVIPGTAPIKKNAMKQTWFTRTKTGEMRYFKFPIHFYTDTYKKWVTNAIPHLINFKAENPQIKFPLHGAYFVSFFFWRERDPETKEIDLSNLYEGVQDLLAGNGGNFLDTKTKKFNHESYQVFADDNYKIIRSHGASFIMKDTFNPRTAVWITPFKLDRLMDVHKYIHGITVQLPQTETLFDLINLD